MRIFATADELAELAKLLGQREQDLVLVVELVLQERDELLARPLRAESEGDRREPPDRSQAERDVVRLELICRGAWNKGRQTSRQVKGRSSLQAAGHRVGRRTDR